MARIRIWKLGFLGGAAARFDAALYEWADAADDADDQDGWPGQRRSVQHAALLRPEDLAPALPVDDPGPRQPEPVPA